VNNIGEEISWRRNRKIKLKTDLTDMYEVSRDRELKCLFNCTGSERYPIVEFCVNSSVSSESVVNVVNKNSGVSVVNNVDGGGVVSGVNEVIGVYGSSGLSECLNLPLSMNGYHYD
jgi:hypothetical protein